MLCISDDYLFLYMMWNMWIPSVYLLLNSTTNSDWVAGILLASFACVISLNVSISKEENHFISCGHGGSKESDMHGSCLASKWQSWDCNPGVLNLRQVQPSGTQPLDSFKSIHRITVLFKPQTRKTFCSSLPFSLYILFLQIFIPYPQYSRHSTRFGGI